MPNDNHNKIKRVITIIIVLLILISFIIPLAAGY